MKLRAFIWAGVIAAGVVRADVIQVGTLNTAGESYNVAKSGNYVFIADGTNGLVSVDVSTPSSPTLADQVSWDACDVRSVAVLGNYAFAGDVAYRLVVVVNITDPTNMAVVGDPTADDGYPLHYSTATPEDILTFTTGGLNYLAVATGLRGVEIGRINDAGMLDFTEIDYFDTPGFGYGVAVSSDMDYLYLADGGSGVVVVNMTDKSVGGPYMYATGNQGRYDTPGTAYAVGVYGNYAFVADGSNGIVSVNYTTKDTPTSPGTLKGVDARDIYTVGTSTSYASDTYNRMTVHYLSPSSPKIYAIADETNALTVRGMVKSGNYVYQAVDVDGLRVYDVSDLGDTLNVQRNRWVMLGAPVTVPAGATANTLFQNDLNGVPCGGVNPTWRFSRWSVANATYLRFNEADYPADVGMDPPTISPGYGYWIYQNEVNTPAVLKIDANQNLGFVRQDVRYVFTDIEEDPAGADRGLNQLANPFNYTYDWRTTSVYNSAAANPKTRSIYDAATAGWVVGYAYTWNPNSSSYTAVNFAGETQPYTIKAWEGFWFEVLQDAPADVRVRFKPAHYTGGLSPEDPVGREERDDKFWALYLSVLSADQVYSDIYNVAGVASAALPTYDPRDAYEFTPPANKFVQLYFTHPDWENEAARTLTYDYRAPEFAQPEVWDFAVRTWNLPGEHFDLVWPTVDEVPSQYSFTLRNLDNGEVVRDLRAENSYRFAVGPDASSVVRFQLTATYTPLAVGSDGGSALPETPGIVSVTPNPFNDQVRITYRMTQRGTATLKLLDLAGREVAQLHRGEMSAGTHQVAWSGGRLSSGTYLVRLEAGGAEYSRKVLLLH